MVLFISSRRKKRISLEKFTRRPGPRAAKWIALLTFVQEDLPTVSAALLAAAGAITWPAAFLGCFLGIWLGARPGHGPLMDVTQIFLSKEVAPGGD